MSAGLFHSLLSMSGDIFNTAVYEFISTSVIDGNQAQWKNLRLQTNPSKNIIYNSSGLIPQEGSFSGTVTNYFANGPTYANGATRVTVLNTVGGESTSAFYKPFTARQLPVGSYVFKCKIKTGTAGVTQNLRYGFSTTSATTNFTVDDNWTTLTINGTVSSAVASNFIVIGTQIGAGNQAFLIDELQFYSSAETIPNYVDDGNDGHIAKPFGIRNPITKNGNYITNSTLAMASPQYPLPKTWSAMTVLFAIQITADTTQILLSTILDAFQGTSATTLTLSIINGEPAFPAAVNRTGKLNNQNFVIIGFSFNNTDSRSYVNEVLVRSTGIPASSFNAQILSILNRLPTTSPLLGDCAVIGIWDTKLSDADWYRAVASARNKVTTMGGTFNNRNWLIAVGDSITASFSAPQGESYAYRMVTEVFTGSEYIGEANFGVGGYTLSILESQLSLVLTRISEVKKGGGEAIVSVLIGRNDNGTLTSNAACDAYWVRLKAYYTSCRNAGAKLIAITALPSGTAATNGGPSGSWETYRNYLNGLMRSEPSAYDALADFGNPAVSIMGDVATCENITYYAADGVHPYPAGHVILAGLFKPIIQSLI